MNPVQIDTTQAATDSIAYVVTDSRGLSSQTPAGAFYIPVLEALASRRRPLEQSTAARLCYLQKCDHG
jgi:hypothetical protein